MKGSKQNKRPSTKNEKARITEYGKCHSCKEEVSHLVCICLKCVSKKISHETLEISIKKCELNLKK